VRKLFYLVVGLQLLFLVAQAGTSQLALNRGWVVRLRTVPVDPRSLFMGNYMALRYEISTIDLSKVRFDGPPSEPQTGALVYVELTPGPEVARPIGVTLRPPGPEDTVPKLRGRVVTRYGSTLWMDYGLDRYYIPEDKRDDVTKLQAWTSGRRPEVIVEVAISRRDGHGMIRRVLVDGKPLDF
jgi:uncharacterized membrane-anchored protein